jgi:hypothetical protein
MHECSVKSRLVRAKNFDVTWGHWFLLLGLLLFASGAMPLRDEIVLPEMLAIELPKPQMTEIAPTEAPLQELLESAKAGAFKVTHDRVKPLPIGGTQVTWTAWDERRGRVERAPRKARTSMFFRSAKLRLEFRAMITPPPAIKARKSCAMLRGKSMLLGSMLRGLDKGIVFYIGAAFRTRQAGPSPGKPARSLLAMAVPNLGVLTSLLKQAKMPFTLFGALQRLPVIDGFYSPAQSGNSNRFGIPAPLASGMITDRILPSGVTTRFIF